MNSLIRWGAHVEAVEMDGEWVVMDATNYTMTKLNELGGFLWSKMDQPISRAELVMAVLEEYEVLPEQAKEDVDGFVEKLTSMGLLETTELTGVN